MLTFECLSSFIFTIKSTLANGDGRWDVHSPLRINYLLFGMQLPFSGGSLSFSDDSDCLIHSEDGNSPRGLDKGLDDIRGQKENGESDGKL